MMIKRRAWFTQSSHHLTMGQHHYFHHSSHHMIIIHLHVKKQAHSSVQLSLYHQARYAELEIMRWWRISRISKDVNQGSSIHHHMPFESNIYFHINFEIKNFSFTLYCRAQGELCMLQPGVKNIVLFHLHILAKLLKIFLLKSSQIYQEKQFNGCALLPVMMNRCALHHPLMISPEKVSMFMKWLTSSLAQRWLKHLCLFFL